MTQFSRALKERNRRIKTTHHWRLADGVDVLYKDLNSHLCRDIWNEYKQTCSEELHNWDNIQKLSPFILIQNSNIYSNIHYIWRQFLFLDVRWRNRFVSLHERKCRVCFNTLEDEFHFVLECPLCSEMRKKCIKKYFLTRPNIHIFSSENKVVIKSCLHMFSKV